MRSRLRVDSGIGSFFKLLEVGFSPYLGFYSHLSVLLMFRLNEAVRGRWIGPKTWDRIIGNFFRNFGEAVSVQSHVGACWVDIVLIYVLICALVCIGPGMAEKFGSLSEPMFCDFPGIVNEGFTILGIVF